MRVIIRDSLPQKISRVMTDKPHTEEGTLENKKCQPVYVIFAAVVASVGGILFGYDIGITSGALLQLRSEFNLTSFDQELIVSSVLVGAFCASFFGGNIVDTWGRKVGISLSCLLFITGALILFFSINIAMIITGRLIVGIAVSLSVTSECTYISEISPPSRRGMMVSLNEVGITTGFLLAYLINYIFITTQDGWRYMFGAAGILAVLQGLGVFFLPNSHYYLLIKGKNEKARKVLCRLRDSNDVDEEIECILSSIEEQKNRRYIDLFSTVSNMRSRMFLGMALVFLQQFSGNANVLYYAPTVFQKFGYHSDSMATLVTVGLGVVKVISTVVTLVIVDRVGRRTLLLAGCLLMATSILILGTVGTIRQVTTLHQGKKPFIIHHSVIVHNNLPNGETTSLETSSKLPAKEELKLLNPDTVEEKLQNSTEQSSVNETMNHVPEYYDSVKDMNFISGTSKTLTSNTTLDGNANSGNVQTSTTRAFFLLQVTENNIFTNSIYVELINETSMIDDDSDMSLPIKIISVVSLMIFVCAYGMSYGPVTWLVLSEIFPGSLRGRAVSVATCINWGSNIIISVTFLDILDAIGIGPTFVAYGFISFGAAIFIFLCVPETKNKTLEEIDVILSKGLLQKDRMCTFSLCHQRNSKETISLAMKTKPDNTSQEQKNYGCLDEQNSSHF